MGPVYSFLDALFIYFYVSKHISFGNVSPYHHEADGLLLPHTCSGVGDSGAGVLSNVEFANGKACLLGLRMYFRK